MEDLDINTKKEKTRKEIIRLLRDLDLVSRKEKDKRILDKVLSCDEFKKSGTVMTYVSMPTEVDTWEIIRKALELGKKVAVPYLRTGKEQIVASRLSSIECMEKGPFGIFQPRNGKEETVPLREIELILVPAVAFDRRNMRLGRGRGYYDRFLSGGKLSSAQTIGLAYTFQVVASLPFEKHDRPVSKVITD